MFFYINYQNFGLECRQNSSIWIVGWLFVFVFVGVDGQDSQDGWVGEDGQESQERQDGQDSQSGQDCQCGPGSEEMAFVVTEEQEEPQQDLSSIMV